MQKKFRELIEKKYGIEVKDIEDGPRQFVSDTFIVKSEKDNQYFIKITDKQLFIPDIIAGLPALAGMYKAGMKQINYPISTINNELWVESDEYLIVILNYIDAKQGYNYSNFALGKLMAEIHAVTQKVNAVIPQEDYEFTDRETFLEYFNESLKGNPQNKIEKNLKAVLKKYESETRNLLEIFRGTEDKMKQNEHNQVITHGDAPGNVLVKSKHELYMIDWDAIKLSPPERDNWIMDHDDDYMQGYRSVFPKYQIDKISRTFFILKYHFQSFTQYLAEVLGEGEDDYRDQNLDGLENNLVRGWILPKIKSIEGVTINDN